MPDAGTRNDCLYSYFSFDDLDRISKWAYQWKMKFNPDIKKQAKELISSNNNKPPFHPTLFFNGNPVTRVIEQKHLGLILDKKLNFESHFYTKLIKLKEI